MEANTLTFDNTKRVLADYADVLVQVYRQALATKGKNASYELSNSIRPQVRQDSNNLYVELRLLDYWYYVEYGRRSVKQNPGALPPPTNAILKWIRIKPVKPRNGKKISAKSLAYLIGRKIWRDGIPATHLLRTSNRAVYNQFKDDIAKALAQDIGKAIPSVKLLL